MVSFRKYGLAILGIIFLLPHLFPQNVPWITPSPTVNTSPLILNSTPTINGEILTEGDYVGVFDRQGRCFGMARWKDTINFGITVYGFDGVNDGFRNGDTLRLRVWLKNENCILDSVSQVSSDSPLIFANAIVNRVNILNFERLAVNYPSETYCLNEKAVFPSLNYHVDDLRFTASQGLFLDTNSGSVNPELSTPGNHTVFINTAYCLDRKQVNLTMNDYPRIETIKDTVICGDRPLKIALTGNFSAVNWSNGQTSREIELSEPTLIHYKVFNTAGCVNSDTFNVKKTAIRQLNFTVDKADCYHPGKIMITKSEIDNATSVISYQLKSRIALSDSFGIAVVPEGIYTLEVINKNGCVLPYRQAVIIEKDCLNDNPVFSPNEDGLDDRYFIEPEGKIKVFDRMGTLRRRLTGPCYFDGNDETGAPLPMGTYLLVSEKGEKITLTILR